MNLLTLATFPHSILNTHVHMLMLMHTCSCSCTHTHAHMHVHTLTQMESDYLYILEDYGKVLEVGFT